MNLLLKISSCRVVVLATKRQAHYIMMKEGEKREQERDTGLERRSWRSGWHDKR
jgi:hypothetical protein